MYCIKCGVKLVDNEEKCPLCQTPVICPPDLEVSTRARQYPQGRNPSHEIRPFAIMIILSIFVVLAMLITYICDFQINDRITWSAYVIGGLIIAYTALLLPRWFKKPNPVILVPVTFVLVAAYLLYINLATGGKWFLSFALPVTGCVAIIATTIVTLLRYVKKGHLYIYGAGSVAAGVFMLILEFLLHINFNKPLHFWSLFPLSVLVLLGFFLFFLGICRKAREALERRFFF